MAALWTRLRRFPGGTWLFSRMLGLAVPYSGTIRPHVRDLRPGYCRISLRDRRRVRNHLDSVHAVALTNLGELTSGLAMTLALPPGIRGIVTRLDVEFLKKGRGALTAVSQCEVPSIIQSSVEQTVTAEITDAAGALVARVGVHWLLGPSGAMR